MLFPIIALLVSSAWAQRPDDASYCNYYAEKKYGASNSDTQFQLVQRIVVLAFGGGFNLSNFSSDLTGILHPGTFEGLDVDLSPWFDGSKETTNVNGNALSVNWLDAGLQPLHDYVSGATPNLTIRSNYNQQ